MLTTNPEPALDTAAGDYAAIARAIDFLSQEWQQQPDLGMLAAHLNLSPAYTQRLFKRWCGVSPKEFVQAITMDQARSLLAGPASILDAALETGLSGGSRLHDLFIDFEAMTPGEYRRRGAGLCVRWGVHPCPFGLAVIMATDRGVCGLSFADDAAGVAAAREDLAARWPAAAMHEDAGATAPLADAVFRPSAARPLRLVMFGTAFELKVWQALTTIPAARVVDYGTLAAAMGAPGAARAVGRSVGRNPIAFVVPCHRVVARGGLGGYHWGLTRKRAIIGWERLRTTAPLPAAYPQ